MTASTSCDSGRWRKKVGMYHHKQFSGEITILEESIVLAIEAHAVLDQTRIVSFCHDIYISKDERQYVNL